LRDKNMIRTVILWRNATVSVFNEKGNQLPRYQGLHDKVKHKIIKDSDNETEFFFGYWPGGNNPTPISILMSRKQWLANKWGISDEENSEEEQAGDA